MFDTLAPPDACKYSRFFVASFRRNDYGDPLADRFFGRIAEEPLRAPVPARDDTVEVLRHDGVLGGLDDCGDVPIAGFAVANALLGFTAFGDVHQHVHSADQSPRGIKKRRWIGNERYARAIRPLRDGLHTSDRASLLQRQSHRALIMRQRGAIGPIELPRAAERACAEFRADPPQLSRCIIVEGDPPGGVRRVDRGGRRSYSVFVSWPAPFAVRLAVRLSGSI